MTSEQQQALEFTAVTLLGKVYEIRGQLERYHGEISNQALNDLIRANDMLGKIVDHQEGF